MPTAAEADGLTVDERPFGAEVRRLAADPGPEDGARAAYGERRLVVLVREGAWAWGVRDFHPKSAARRACATSGSRRTACGERCRALHAVRLALSAAGRFTRYGTGRTVRVANADGRERGLGLGVEPAWASRSRRGSARWNDVGAGAPEAGRGAAT